VSQISESHFSFESSVSDFTGAVAVGASTYADLTIGGAGGQANGGASGGPAKTFITTLLAVSMQNIDMRVEFLKRTQSRVVNTASFFPTNLIGWVNLIGTDDNLPANWPGGRFAVATTYGTAFAWFVDGLSIPYEDADGVGQLHVNVVNQSGTAKSAGTAGYLYLRVGTVKAS
jgi:hypothetical protein